MSTSTSISKSAIFQLMLSLIDNTGLTILILSIIVPLFIMMLYLVIYLHSIKDNKPVDKSLEKYYSVVSMIYIVIIGLLIIRMFLISKKLKIFLVVNILLV